jgi:hypothetical protein
MATVGCSDCLGLLRNTGIPEPFTGLDAEADELGSPGLACSGEGLDEVDLGERKRIEARLEDEQV